MKSVDQCRRIEFYTRFTSVSLSVLDGLTCVDTMNAAGGLCVVDCLFICKTPIVGMWQAYERYEFT